MFLSFAPMEGVTGAAYRRIHSAMFPGADSYYAPFIAPDSQGNFRLKHLRDILPDNNQGTVVSKHKGAGMLADPAALDAFLRRVFDEAPVKISVKTRMGLNSTEEFPSILEIYKRYPLSELIIHARDRAGMYQSRPDQEAFARAFGGCPFPVCYNGNLFNAEHLRSLTEKVPGLERVMLGRGAAANPALFRVLRGGAPLERQELREFHDRLLADALSSGLSDHYAMARMKELWYYMIHLFPDSARAYKALNKSRCLSDYRSAAETIFSSCSVDPDTGFHG